jgi:DNA polymerase-4
MRISANSYNGTNGAVIMYIDMNSYFASVEQQDNPEFRDRPLGVLTFDSPNACIIAPSIEAKRFGVKTGMRLGEGKALCPQIVTTTTRPHRYREIHVAIMKVLTSYCDAANVMAKSIDEAVMNFSSYKLVYPDFRKLAQMIKDDIRKECGDYIKCSIGIAPNSFLAKLGTELQKPDGLIEITPDNVDGYLATMKLTDLPGIAKANEKRLNTIGIRTPLDLRHSSDALLRRAFGGVVGNYWHSRLHFRETDFYKNDYRAMSATRTVSQVQRESKQSLESLLIALCTRLEQRMVKQDVFCRELSFFIRYKDFTSWETKVKLADPTQDAMEMRSYIYERIAGFERTRNIDTIFSNKTQQMGVTIANFVHGARIQYSLFENKIKADTARKTMYNIKDRYGKNIVRKACETIRPHEMADAIGFGSVKDLYEGDKFNKYLLEED